MLRTAKANQRRWKGCLRYESRPCGNDDSCFSDPQARLANPERDMVERSTRPVAS